MASLPAVSYRLLAIGLLLRLGADAIYSVDTAFSSYTGTITDPAWMLAYVFCGAAALHPSMRSLSEVAPGRTARFSRSRLALLASSSLLAPVLLIVQGLFTPSHIDWPSIGIGAVTLFLLVLTRLYGLVSQVQDQAVQLEALAHNDGLTGVANRRSWDLELVREMAIARRVGAPLSVALIDLDHFKRFNDRFGHQAGDRLLTRAAALWKANLREPDFIARYGGEEFGVILNHTAAEEALPIMQRLLAATPDGQSFSAGLATWDGTETPERLLGRVDAALYASKDAGRARVTIAAADGAASPIELPDRMVSAVGAS